MFFLSLFSHEISRRNSIIKAIDSSLYILGKEDNEPNLNIEKLTMDQENRSFQAKGVKIKIGDQWVGRLPSFSGKAKKNSWEDHKFNAIWNHTFSVKEITQEPLDIVPFFHNNCFLHMVEGRHFHFLKSMNELNNAIE